VTRPALLFDVPTETDQAACKWCGAPVYWILTRNKKKMPVDCHAGIGCQTPTTERVGRGVSHFATCPKAAQFRQRPTTPGAA
jgi:hypothetical protein